MKKLLPILALSAGVVFNLKAQTNIHSQKILANKSLIKQATADDYKNIIKLKTGAQPAHINKVSINKSNNSQNSANPVSNYITNVMKPAPECDTLLTQWETPTPTVVTYGFGGGWISGIPDPVNSTNPTDAKGIYERYTTPNPGVAVVGGVRVGLGTLHDLDSNTTFQVVVYDDNGTGGPGTFLGGLGGLNPTTLGVPGSGIYTDYWIPFTTTLIPTTPSFHVGVEIIPGDGSDSLVVMTSCLGATACTLAQGENDASNHIITSGAGLENFLTVYGADFDVDVIPTFGEYAIFNYSAASYCTSAANETPAFLGASGGTFSSTPTGLSINSGTGEITFSTSTPGTYTVTYTAPGTCAKTTNQTVIVNGPGTGTTNNTICYNTSFTYADATVSSNIVANESHVSTFTGAAANGCDSILTENVIVVPQKTGTENSTICSNGSVIVNGNTYNAGNPTGTEVISNVGPFNCDSTVTINLNVLPAKTGSVTTTICNNGSVVVNGNTYNAGNPTGTEVISNVGPFNCDSTVTINLTVLPALTGSVTTTICNNGSVVVNGNTYNAGNPTGTEVISNVGPFNCDSTVTVNLNVLPALTGTITQTICFGDSIVVNGTTYNTTVTGATEVFTNVGPNNCDSTVTINLTVSPAIDITVTNAAPTLTANQSGATYRWLDCDNNYAVIPTATNQAFTASSNGNYAVEITMGSCVDTSACENVTTTEVNANDKLTGVNIYPNPTSNNLTIELGVLSTEVNLTLTSVEGKIVYQETNMTTSKVSVDMSNNSKGIYFLRVEANNQYKVYKVVKE